MPGLHASYRRAQRRQGAVFVLLEEGRQPAPGLGQLTYQWIAGGIAVDPFQDRSCAGRVAVGAQRQLRPDNVVQPRQNWRPIHLDELAAAGQRGAGLIDSFSVE